VADGTFFDRSRRSTKNDVNIFMPNNILAGDSGGNQNRTVVNADNKTHGRTRM